MLTPFVLLPSLLSIHLERINFLFGFTLTLNLVNKSLLIRNVLLESFIVKPIGTSVYSLLLKVISTNTIGIFYEHLEKGNQIIP